MDNELAMDAKSGWLTVLRLVWIAGGVVAVNEPGPDVQITAGMAGRSLSRLSINTYGDLFAALMARGFPTLGAIFVVSPDKLQGLQRPDFRAISPTKQWLVWDVQQRWRQIAFAAGKSNHMPLMDVASSIASGLRYSQMRLHDLATAYGVQLRGRLHESEAKDYQAFKDTNSFEVYKAIHAFFWEMAVLSDTLAEFAAAFCFSRAGVRKMGSLLRSLHKDHVSDPLADEILRATDQATRGWLATFINYRNFFTHVAPMEQAVNIAFAVQDVRILPDGTSIPQIYYPLPQDASKVNSKRSQGILFNSLEELSAASCARHDRTSEPDALDYLHSSLNQLAELSAAMASRSPVVPQPITLGPDDLIGPVHVTRQRPF